MGVAVRFTDVVPPPPRVGWPGPVSLEIEEGEFVVMVTNPTASVAIVRMIAGLREPVEGVVEALGERPGRLSRYRVMAHRRRLGIGFGEPSGLVSNLTLRMNLVVPMLYSGLTDVGTAHRKAAELLERASLLGVADRRPDDVPADVRREAVILRAVVREPDLLLLEEPVNSLSDMRAGWLLRLAREKARTILLTTTEREGIQFDFADRLVRLDEQGLEVTVKRNDEVGVL